MAEIEATCTHLAGELFLKTELLLFETNQCNSSFLTDFNLQKWDLAERGNEWVSYSIIAWGWKLDLLYVDGTQPFWGILTHPHFKKHSVERNVDSGRIEYDWKLIKESSTSLPYMPGHNHLALNCPFARAPPAFFIFQFPSFLKLTSKPLSKIVNLLESLPYFLLALSLAC